MRKFLDKYGQFCFNVFLFFFFLDVTAHRIYEKALLLKHDGGWYGIYFAGHWGDADWGRLQFSDWSFLIQNIVMCSFLLVRFRHKAVDRNLLHQSIAMMAFISGAFMFGGPASESHGIGLIASVIVFAANLLGIMSLFNLGRSFGILIALRHVKTGGVYSVVRHPMYCSDMLLRLGFIIGHFSLFTALIGVFSIACYVIRAIFEERFLSRAEEYKAYMIKVKYRFIPFIY